MENKRYTDLTYLKTISRGNDEFLLKVIHTFISQVRSDLDKIQQYMDEKKWDSIHFIAHKIKPSFQFVGIKALEEVIVNIETYAKEQNNLDLLPPLVFQLTSIYEASVEELNEEEKKILST